MKFHRNCAEYQISQNQNALTLSISLFIGHRIRVSITTAAAGHREELVASSIEDSKSSESPKSLEPSESTPSAASSAHAAADATWRSDESTSSSNSTELCTDIATTQLPATSWPLHATITLWIASTGKERHSLLRSNE